MDHQHQGPATVAQIRAREINWGIFCLRGMHKIVEILHHRQIIQPKTYSKLYLAMDEALQDMQGAHYANGWTGKRSRGQGDL